MDNNNHLGKRIISQSNPINPFKFYKDKEHAVENPFVNVKDSPNGTTRFAILRTTENGKYVRGGQLWFKLGKVEIFTDIDNIIFVDTVNDTLIVQSGKKIINEIAPEDPEHRQYIIMMKCYVNGDETYSWESMTGRITCYNYIVDNIDSLGISPTESIVLTENVPYKDAFTIADFVRYLKNSELVEDDGFDIDEYIY